MKLRGHMTLLPLLLLATGDIHFAAGKTNLVALVTDDQGRWAMGAYGNSEIRTPNMDRIASEGALFTNAFVSTPVCSPSRATYLTGRYATECGITDWISPLEASQGVGLALPTWPEVLQKHGYRTALIGKWHLGESPRHHPTRRGFDHFYGFLGGGTTPMDPELEISGIKQKVKGSLPDLLTNEAIRFLEANRSRPFALLVHFRAPHTPYGPVPEEDSSQYKDLDPTVPDFPAAATGALKTDTKAYYASVSSVDRNVGRLLRALKSLDLERNTLVVFTSDNGYNLGRHGISTKGNGHWLAGGINGPPRANIWDTSLAVPLAVRWPTVVRAGLTVDNLVSHLDMFRTVLGALQIPWPEGLTVHGLDFSPLLRGESEPRRPAIFAQYDFHNSGLAYLRMIRTSAWKLVRHFHANSMDELYDLRNDPDELRNLLRTGRLTQSEELLLNRLRGELERWMESIDDPLLKDPY